MATLTSQDHVFQPLSTCTVTASRREAGAWHSIGRVPGCPEPTPRQEWLSWCRLPGHGSSWLDALQPLAQPCQHLATVTEEKHIPLPPDGISCFVFLLKWCPLPPMLAGTAEQSSALLALSTHALLEGGWAEIILSPSGNGLVPSPAQHAAHSVLSSQHWTPQRVRPQDGLSFSLLPRLSVSYCDRATKSPVPQLLGRREESCGSNRPSPAENLLHIYPTLMRRHRLLGLRTAGMLRRQQRGPTAAMGVPWGESPQNRHHGSSRIPFLPLQPCWAGLCRSR